MNLIQNREGLVGANCYQVFRYQLADGSQAFRLLACAIPTAHNVARLITRGTDAWVYYDLNFPDMFVPDDALKKNTLPPSIHHQRVRVFSNSIAVVTAIAVDAGVSFDEAARVFPRID